MVLPLILLALAIVALAIYYWYITLPIIIIIVLIWKYKTGGSKKKEDNESRRSQSSSYQNYSQSDYSKYNSNSNNYYKKTTQENSDQKSQSQSKSKSKASQAKENRVNSRLKKYNITPEEAKAIFGRTWRSKLSKQEWEFYYVVRYIEIDFEFDYNNRCRKKYGHLYSKVLQIIKIVMEENADMREEENRYEKYYYQDFNWDDDDYYYKNHYEDDSDIDDKEIEKAFDTFGLARESTKEQIKSKYRELTLKFHPDKNKSKDATLKMTEINRAYEIIMGAVVQ